MVARVHECSDFDVTYGFITTDNEDVTVEMVQNEICRIKGELADADWTVEDVIERLPAEWNCKFAPYEQNEISI